MLSPEQAKGIRALLRDGGTHFPEGLVQEQLDDALAWHEDGPGGAWLTVTECAIVADALGGPGGHQHSIRAWLFEKVKAGAVMADHGNPARDES